MRKGETKGRVWWLMRRQPERPKESIFFALPVVIESDEDGSFSATVTGMESRLIAVGDSTSDAEHQALGLFRDLIDVSLNSAANLSQVLPETVIFRTVAIPVEQAEEFIKTLRAALESAGGEDSEDDDFGTDGDNGWVDVPTYLPAIQHLALTA